MNTELKPMLKEVYDLVVLGEDVVAKKYAALIADGLQAGEDIPAVVSNWPSLSADLKSLVTDPASDADVLAYVGTLAGGQGAAVAGLVSALAGAALALVEQYISIKNAVAALKPPAPVAPAPTPPAAA